MKVQIVTINETIEFNAENMFMAKVKLLDYVKEFGGITGINKEGFPVFKDLYSPMTDGETYVRYEDSEVYEMLSR